MKVETNFLNISMPQNERVQQPAQPDARSSSRTQSVTTAGDGVDLGSQAGLVATAKAAGAADQSNVIQSLRALVQSGRYQVDSAALSESIVTAASNGY
jgi:anti-sigma28 factor (negative regulator of flagellin synthesis)